MKEHTLGDRINSLLFHRKYNELVPCLTSISKDRNFIDKMNGIQEVTVPKYQAKGIPKYDVFISHANRDKEDFVEEFYQAINKLGIKVFYDKDVIDWGDNWKKVILDSTKKSEFAVIVISENFFDREWTEKELEEFLSRQNIRSRYSGD